MMRLVGMREVRASICVCVPWHSPPKASVLLHAWGVGWQVLQAVQRQNGGAPPLPSALELTELQALALALPVLGPLPIP